MVCKTWFESSCNTTYIEGEEGNPSPKPQTWCSKVIKCMHEMGPARMSCLGAQEDLRPR